jgi:hypothetical protein
VPRDLGYYDLRVEDTRVKQAQLAKKAGIEGFCYWHYWFNGKRLLELPFNEVLKSGQPDFPFCLGWANHDWSSKIWSPTGSINTRLIEQTYPDDDDIISHFYANLDAFHDKRYILIDSKPVFLIWDTEHLPDNYKIIEIWNKLAKENGLNGIYFIGFSSNKSIIDNIMSKGFDAVCFDNIKNVFESKFKFINKIKHYYRKTFILPNKQNYSKYSKQYLKEFPDNNKVIPCIYPNFDHTPRSGKYGRLLFNATPDKFCNLVDNIILNQKYINQNDDKIVFIKSWNEWGEGNYLEPDLLNGDTFINEMNKRYNNKSC